MGLGAGARGIWNLVTVTVLIGILDFGCWILIGIDLGTGTGGAVLLTLCLMSYLWGLHTGLAVITHKLMST